MVVSVKVAVVSSPTAHEFSAKNRFEEEEKEEEGREENMEVLYVNQRNFFQ